MVTKFRYRTAFLRAMLASLVGVGALYSTGCKGTRGGPFTGREGADGNLLSRSDPLLGGKRIPPQNLPVPGKDSYGAKDNKRDPIFGSNPSNDRPAERAGQGEKKDTPVSRGTNTSGKEPFRLSKETTPAILAAGGIKTDDSELSIGDRRTPGNEASKPKGPVPFKPATATRPMSQIEAELKSLGARLGSPEREGNQFVIRGQVPLDAGRFRWYEGVGNSVEAAAQLVLDQVKSDRK